MAFKSVRDEQTGRVVFRYDPATNRVEIKARELTGGTPRRYDLSPYRDDPRDSPDGRPVDSSRRLR